MKKLILFLVAAITVHSLQAQDNKDDKPNKITFIAGWNNSKYVGGEDQISKTDFKSGLILGINKDVKIVPLLWANGGLLYYQNGAKSDDGDYKFDYLMLPAGLKLRFGPAYLMGGGYGAYRLSAKIDDTDLDKKDWNRLDFGMYTGAGLKIMIFSLNFKYNWGLSDVTNGKSNNPDYNLQNQFYSITLGIGIP